MIARYFEQLSEEKVKCLLCPRNCIIKNGETGNCRIRRNIGGSLTAEAYNLFSSVSFDPIEKKPLYHYFPGRTILSVGSVGCNLHCQWCQNCEISQSGVMEYDRLISYTPEKLLELAKRDSQNIGIAYTYNEPTINFESNIEIAELFKKNELKNVLVTNGYISREPLAEYLEYIDAFNIDIKAFDNDIHIKYTGAKLKPVLDNSITIKESGKHLELTCLIVPGVSDNNDKFEKLVGWISTELGRNIPLHISRYFPRYRYSAGATPESKLEEFCTIAASKLDFVYAGNMHSAIFENTICPVCKATVIRRKGYYAQILADKYDGKCTVCGAKIFVV